MAWPWLSCTAPSEYWPEWWPERESSLHLENQTTLSIILIHSGMQHNKRNKRSTFSADLTVIELSEQLRLQVLVFWISGAWTLARESAVLSTHVGQSTDHVQLFQKEPAGKHTHYMLEINNYYYYLSLPGLFSCLKLLHFCVNWITAEMKLNTILKCYLH